MHDVCRHAAHAGKNYARIQHTQKKSKAKIVNTDEHVIILGFPGVSNRL